MKTIQKRKLNRNCVVSSVCYLLSRVWLFVIPWTVLCSSVHGIFEGSILEWAIPFFRRSSQPRNGTQVSCIAGRFFTVWATHFSSVAQSCLDSLWPHGLQHTRLPCPSPSLRAYSSSHPLSWWCHPTSSSSVVPFSSSLQSFPASGFQEMSQFFISGGQSIRVSASASVLPVHFQDWFLLGWTGWISLLSKSFSRVFSSTTVQKHQFFSAQLSL